MSIIRFIKTLPVALCAALFIVTLSGQAQNADTGAQNTAVQPVAADQIAAPAAEKEGEDDKRPGAKRLTDYDLPGLKNKIQQFQSLDTIEVVDIIEYLAQRGGLNNIVISKGVSGLTTKLKFENISVGEALEVVLSVNRLAYEVKGGIITIMSDEEYKALYGASFYENRNVEIVELKYADAARVAAMLEPVKSAIGLIVNDPVTGTLILVDTPDKLAEMHAVIGKADISTIARTLPTETKSFVLQYATVEDIEKEVTALLTKEAGSMRADKRTRTVLVTDLPHVMRKVEELIRVFDKSPRQVFIEAKVVETTLNDDFSMGINWNHLFEGLDPRFSLQSLSQPGLPASPIGRISYNTILAGGDLQVVLDALQSVGKVKILSNPHIAVMDGKEATIQVITEQPYKEVAFESGTTNVTGVTYLFKEIGVQMAVTPRINDKDYISVDIKPTISSISQWYDGAPQEGTPVVRKAFAETTVMVKDGVTIIIGGMIQDRDEKTVMRVPLLGRIPVLGQLFRRDISQKVNTETVVFMTPRIMTGDTLNQRERYTKKTPRPLRPVGEDMKKQAKPLR